MIAMRVGRAWLMLSRSFSEILNGHASDLIHQLLYSLAMFLRGIDLQLVSTEEMGLNEKRAFGSSSSGGPLLEHILNMLNITSDDAIIDLGCGKGGALITMKKYQFRKLAGIELSHELTEKAKDNFSKLRIGDIVLHCCDAGDFSDYDDFNYIYMYNPFPCQVMAEVMAHVSDSLARLPRDMYILYNHPRCHETIMKTSLFRHTVSLDMPLTRHQLFIYHHSNSGPSL